MSGDEDPQRLMDGTNRQGRSDELASQLLRRSGWPPKVRPGRIAALAALALRGDRRPRVPGWRAAVAGGVMLAAGSALAWWMWPEAATETTAQPAARTAPASKKTPPVRLTAGESPAVGVPVEKVATAPGCKRYTPGADFALCGATYVGGAADDGATAVRVLPDGNLLIAGTFPALGAEVPEHVVLEGGPAGIVRVTRNGRLLAVTRLGGTVSHMDLDRSGAVVVTGDFGVAALDPSLRTALWRHPLNGGGQRVSVAEDGAVAALAGDKSVQVVGPDGAARASWNVPDDIVEDVAFGRGQVFVAASNIRRAQRPCSKAPVVAALRAYDPAGSMRWKAWDWSAAEIAAADLCVNTRARRVHVGRDGHVYVAGNADGPRNAFRRHPRDLAREAPNAGHDAHSEYRPPHRSAVLPVGYVAQLDATTGEPQIGQFLIPRLKNGEPSTLWIDALSTDEQGHLFLGGRTSCCVAGRDGLTLSGQRVGFYMADEPWVAVMAPNLAGRLSWTVLTAGGQGRVLDVASGAGTVAAIATAGPLGRLFVTGDAAAPVPAGGRDAYLAVWPAP